MNTSAQLVTRLSRDTLAFAASTFATVLLAFATVAVVTGHLSPASYGELAIYYLFASLLTIVYGLIPLQGTLLRVFGASEDEAADADDAAGPVGNRRAALTTGLALATAVAATGTLLVYVLARPLTELLFDEGGSADVLVMAAVAGGLGSIWRLVSNVTRFEAKPWKYASLTNARPVLLLGYVSAVLFSGGDVADVVAANAAATGTSIVLALVVTWRNYELRLDRAELAPIAAAGKVYVPLIVGVWVVQNVDMYILSHYAASAEVGLYRLANRVSSVMSYAVSAFLLAWVPLARTPIFDAVRRRHGTAGLGRLLVSYYCFGAIGLLLTLAVGAELLTGVAPPAYAEAAPLVPLIGLGFLAYGLFVVIYRGASFPRRRDQYFRLAWVAAATLVGSALALVPRHGGYGAAWSVVAAFAVASAGMLVLSERGPNPLRVPWWRVGAAAATAAGCYAAAQLAGRASGSAGVATEIAAPGLYVALVVGLGVLPREHVRSLASGVMALGGGRSSRRHLTRRLGGLTSSEQAGLRAALDGRAHGPVRDAVALLRRVGGVAGPRGRGGIAHDEEIGRWLLGKEALAERDARFRRLRHVGVDPLELHELEVTVTRLREIPSDVWGRDGS